MEKLKTLTDVVTGSKSNNKDNDKNKAISRKGEIDNIESKHDTETGDKIGKESKSMISRITRGSYSAAKEIRAIHSLPSAKAIQNWVFNLPYHKDYNDWDSSIQHFYDYIQSTGVLNEAVHVMIAENNNNYGQKAGFNSFNELCGKLNTLLTHTPQYVSHKKDNKNDELLNPFVGVPMAALFWHVACNEAGMSLFLNDYFNIKALKPVLQKWKEYLDSYNSFTINNNGNWLSEEAKNEYNFDDYQPSLNKPPFWNSWNDFFTRKFKDGKRDFAAIKNKDNNNGIIEYDHTVIQQPNDGTSYRLSLGVRKTDKFWIKNMPYSLLGIFTYDWRGYASKFEGGIIFQSHLNPFNYHNYHTPVSGVVKDIKLVEGAYFPQLVWLYDVEDNGGGRKSLPWLASVNARGLFLIDTNGYSNIGFVCMVCIGMHEVSSVNFTPNIGDTINVGDRIGCFKFGGSSIALLFEDVSKYGKQLKFNDKFNIKTNEKQTFKLGEKLANVEVL